MKRLFGGCLLARIGLAAAVFAGTLWISGCGGNNNPVKPDGGNKSLTLPSGQAWVDTSGGNGIIFAADGRFFEISKMSSWWMDREGTYTVDDIEIKLAYSGDTGTLLFKLSKGGDTLTLYRAGGIRPPGYNNGGVYAKTSGVKFVIPPPNPGTGGNLVLSQGQAWVNAATGIGFIFGSDSIVSMIGGANGIWVLTNEGIYSAKDGHIMWTIHTYWGDDDTVSYTVSGNSLAITLDDYQTIAFAKTSNVNISANTGGSLVLPSGQAWVRETGYSWDGVLGFIFESNGKASILLGDDGVWDLAGTGTYTARGNRITIAMKTLDDEAITGTYTVSGNSFILTLDDGITLVFTKRSGISVAPHIGGNLVLPSGQAWTYREGSTENGYIFQANGQVLEISRYQGGSWSTDQRGTYTTNDANITVIWNYGCYNDDDEWDERCDTYTQTGVYSVSGNSLVLVLNGHRMNLTITSGVTVRSFAPDLLKKPVAPAPKARSGWEILTFRRP